MKKAIVRVGYVVHWRNKMYKGGEEIPPNIIKEIQDKQSWKLEIIEVKDGEEKESEKEKSTASASGDSKEKEKIEDITANRMVGDNLTSKRGK